MTFRIDFKTIFEKSKKIYRKWHYYPPDPKFTANGTIVPFAVKNKIYRKWHYYPPFPITSTYRGGGDRKFSKIVELLGPQNRKIVELQEVKIVQKAFFKISFDFEL